VASPTQRANVAAAVATGNAPAARVERRSASRPWSKAPRAAAAAAAEASAEAGAHKKVVGSPSNDSEWQEF
jgi:hypothetical protein